MSDSLKQRRRGEGGGGGKQEEREVGVPGGLESTGAGEGRTGGQEG